MPEVLENLGWNRLVVGGEGQKDPEGGQISDPGVVVSFTAKVELHSDSYKSNKRNKVVKPTYIFLR